MRTTKAIISTGNFLYNLNNIKERTGKNRKICIAVKADAYGHGAAALAGKAIETGSADCLGVAAVSEGAQLREKGIKAPVMLFSLASSGEIGELFDFDITPFTADTSYLSDIAKEAHKRGVKKTVHLKVDTGMRRIGCRPEDAPSIAQFIAENKNLDLGGVCTHFPVSDSREREFTENQIALFKNTVDKIREKKIAAGLIHAANSGAILQYPDAFFDMVRPGIILYGSYPDTETEKTFKIKPVMTFESAVIFIKKIKKGERVSYGLTWEAKDDTFIATIPAGYADGYNRLLSSRGIVEIKGKTYPVAGRVCMDQFMVDLGKNHNIETGDTVTLFGGESSVSGDFVAQLCGTIPYEIYCNINKRVPRITV
ncbi:MAG: alanine racemase [Spirochaetia bacterium]|jgi:alanine racemase|nr:alanine racemase [Spirochaetia bacterium]